MKTYSIFVYYLIGLMLFSGCERAEKNNITTINFRAPVFEASKSASSSKLSGTAPASKSELNCFGILVSGPDDFLRKNRCYQSTNQAATTFSVGIFHAGVPAGQELSAEVPSGVDRVIRLVGFKAENGYCYSWLGSKTDPENYVSPGYILGSVGQLQLEPGTTKEISIPVNFDNSKWFDDCEGPDFDSGTTAGGGSPTGVAIKKLNFPLDYFVKTSATTCQLFELSLINSSGNQTSLPAGQSLTFDLNAQQQDGTAGNLGALSIYQDATNCAAGGVNGQITQVTYNSLMNKRFIYVKGVLVSDSSAVYVKVSASSVNLPLSEMKLPTANHSSIGFDVAAPPYFVPGACYAVTVQRKDFLGQSSVGYTNITFPNGGAAYMSDCSTTYTSDYASSAVIYVKAPSEMAANLPFNFDIDGGTALTKHVYSKTAAGTPTPVGLRVFGYTSFPSNTSCGPDSAIRVVLVNAANSIVPWPNAATNSMVVNYSTDFVKLSTDGCLGSGLGTEFQNNSTYLISRGEYYKTFYVNSLGTPNANLSIGFTSGNATISTPTWNFQLLQQ